MGQLGRRALPAGAVGQQLGCAMPSAYQQAQHGQQQNGQAQGFVQGEHPAGAAEQVSDQILGIGQ